MQYNKHIINESNMSYPCNVQLSNDKKAGSWSIGILFYILFGLELNEYHLGNIEQCSAHTYQLILVI